MIDLGFIVVVLSLCVLALTIAAVVALVRRPGNSYSETYHYGTPPVVNDFLVNHRGVGREEEYDLEDDDLP